MSADNNRNGATLEKRTYTVEEIAALLEIGKAAAYNLIKEDCFRSVRIGTSIRISKPSFDDWLDNQQKEMN